jgi:hypothetical protein
MDRASIKLDFSSLSNFCWRWIFKGLKMTQKAEIPSFFLFGEPLRTVEGKFLHLEALDDRSRPNDWNIRAHAHADLNHVFHITSAAG